VKYEINFSHDKDYGIQSVFEDAKVYSDYRQSKVYELLNKTYQLLKHVLGR